LKLFRVNGEIKKKGIKTPFTREVLAAKSEHAVERTYAELGSKHRVKRFHINITNVEEVPLEEIQDPQLKNFLGEEKVGSRKRGTS
jgi:large subunit ribosomal protein LX